MDAPLDESVDRKLRRETRTIEDDSSAPSHLLKLRPIDESKSHVGLDFVDDRNVLQVDSSTRIESINEADLEENNEQVR